MKKALYTFLAKHFGYVVYVQGDHQHYALSFTEAMSWLSCYPASFGAGNITKRGKHVCSRYAIYN